MKTTIDVVGGIAYLSREFEMNEKRLLNQMKKVFSSKIKGAEYAYAFKNGYWDGTVCLLKYYGDTPGVPLGLLPQLQQELEKAGFEVEVTDSRPPAPTLSRPAEFMGAHMDPPKIPFDYQMAAFHEVTKPRGVMTGRGAIVIPVRGGKTLTSALLVAHFQTPTLFLCPSKLLLAQTAKVFQELLAGPRIGICGQGVWNPGEVTVATVQTLTTKMRTDPGAVKQLLDRTGLIIADEFHHYKGEAWRNIMLASKARYHIGLSGTLWYTPGEAMDEDVIWFRATTGPILYRTSVSTLIEKGRLKAPHILVYPVPNTVSSDYTFDDGGSAWASWYKHAIVNNYTRNSYIADLACQAADLGLRVLIDTGRKEQLDAISKMLDARKVRHSIGWGGTTDDKRARAMKKQASGEIPILLGTIFGEGIDMPELEVVINAEGQASEVAAMQRLRNMTAFEGKGDVYVIDFEDDIGNRLREHAEKRIGYYESIRGFTVERVKQPPHERPKLPAWLIEKETRRQQGDLFPGGEP